jgi:broad specificity phosphatase PhoE
MGNLTRIVLVRHGQTAWNREVRFRGQADLPLDGLGLAQAQATGRYLVKRWPVEAVYASPLQRAVQTAEAIAAVHGLQVQPFKGLLDINFGAWQGRSPDELAQHYPDLLQAWWEAPHTVRFPDGESLEVVRSRAVGGLSQLIARHRGHAIGLVGHAVVNRVLLCAVLGLGNEHFWRIRQDTCAVNVFEADEESDYTVTVLNDTSHLQEVRA